MIGYPSRQDGVILPAQDCPFCSRNNFSPSPSGYTKVYLSQNIIRDSKKIFCDFSVGMEFKNEKTETRHHFCIYLASFLVLGNKQVRRSFFQCSLCHIINPLLTKLVRSNLVPRVFHLPTTNGQDGWILASFSFCVSIQKNAKRERGQYPAILTSRSVSNCVRQNAYYFRRFSFPWGFTMSHGY